MGVATKVFPGFDDPLAQPNLLLRVGEHVLDAGTLRLTTRPDYPRLTSKAFAVLLQLVRDRGNTVTREQLLDRVWADRVTTPDVLTQAIKELRRAFADDAKPSRYIETIPKVGYRLLAEIAILTHEKPFGVPLPVQAGNDPYLEANIAALQPAQRPTARPNLPRWPWLVAAIAAIGIALLYFPRAATSPVSPPAQWQISDVRALSSDPGAEQRPHIAPDGTRVAYSKADPQTHLDRILLRAVGATRSLAWTSDAPANEDTPLWSPDGKAVVFERVSDSACELVVTSNLGGDMRVVGNCQSPATNYYDWTPDGGKLIIAERSARTQGHLALTLWDLASGEKQPLAYARPAEADDLNAHYSPDGKMLAFRRGLAPYSDLWVMTADGRDAHQLTNLRASIHGYTWSRDSSALIVASNHEGRFGLYAIDARSGALQSLHVSPAEFPDAARHDDTIVYEIPRVQYKLAEHDLGENGSVRTPAPSTGSEIQPTCSPVDSRIAFISDRSGTQQLWLYDRTTGATTVLTDFRDALLSNPSWSADGAKLLVTVRRPDNAQLFEIELASRRQRLLSKNGDDVHAASYAADPDSVLLTLGIPGKDNQLLLVEHAGTSSEQRRLLESGLWHSEFDSATRRLYYSRNTRYGIFARTLSASGELSAETPIATDIMNGWQVVGGRIWHFAPSRYVSPSSDLLEFNPLDGSERVLAHIEAEPRDALFSVSPQHDRILYTTIVSEDTDIGALRLTRAH
jgi:Tol biopolymer transport system component/DNA-binding winged helix-turn-helix (wHTH) protein